MASLNEINNLLNNHVNMYHRTITINGDANTYYPVCICFGNNNNAYYNDLIISRHLGELPCNPTYPGNHPDKSSAFVFSLKLRSGGWDGNGNRVNVEHLHQPYANHLANFEMQGNAYHGVVIWLRGGTTLYNIYSSKPLSRCDVYYSTTNLGYGQYAYNVAPTTSVLALQQILSQASAFSMKAISALYADNIYVTDQIHASKVFNAVWNDYAELFERGEQTEAGDIIALDTSSPTEQYVKADSSSKRVIGVHSDTYGHLIGGEKLNNYEDNFEKFIPIGLAGRVNVKVKGKVELGDYIVPSDEKGIGRAYNKDIDDRDMIIGYLVEADEREDVRRLKIFINKK